MSAPIPIPYNRCDNAPEVRFIQSYVKHIYDSVYFNSQELGNYPVSPPKPRRASRRHTVKKVDIQNCKSAHAFIKLRKQVIPRKSHSIYKGFSDLEKINWGLSQLLIIDMLSANHLPKAGRKNIENTFHRHIRDVRTWVNKSHSINGKARVSALRLLTRLERLPISKIRL